MDKKKRMTFIVNPISGTHNKEAILRLIDELLDHNKFDYEVRKTEYAGHASEIAARAAEEGVDTVVAIGGDRPSTKSAARLSIRLRAWESSPAARETGLQDASTSRWTRKGHPCAQRRSPEDD